MPVGLNDEVTPPVSCAECRIGRVSVYGPTLSTSPETINACRQAIVKFEAQRTILRTHEIPTTICTIYSGWAFRFMQLSNGRRQILSFMIPGDFIALESLFFPGAPLPFSIKALTVVSLCKFPLSNMADILRQTEEQQAETRAALQRHCSAMCRRLADIGRRSAAGRLAQLILEIEARLKKRNLSRNGMFKFPPRQEDVADALGLTPEHVNRTLVDLRKRRIIEFDREQLQILDPHALRHMAEEE